MRWAAWAVILRAFASVSSSGIPCTLPLSMSAILRRVPSCQALSTDGSNFTVFGSQHPIGQIGDCVLGPIAGLFDDLICAQLHIVSLHRCSITCNIVLGANMKFCVSFA
jgi:hypothetical protein